MRNHEPDYKFGANDAEYRKEYRELHEAERELERAKADRELRRWCIEQCEPHLHFERKIEAAEALYDWIRNQPKADAA
jgi:hypothetical protein